MSSTLNVFRMMLLKKMSIFTCTFGSRYIRAGLVLEEQSAVICACIDVALVARTGASTTIISEGHGTSKWARDGECFFPKHRVQ